VIYVEEGGTRDKDRTGGLAKHSMVPGAARKKLGQATANSAQTGKQAAIGRKAVKQRRGFGQQPSKPGGQARRTGQTRQGRPPKFARGYKASEWPDNAGNERPRLRHPGEIGAKVKILSWIRENSTRSIHWSGQCLPQSHTNSSWHTPGCWPVIVWKCAAFGKSWHWGVALEPTTEPTKASWRHRLEPRVWSVYSFWSLLAVTITGTKCTHQHRHRHRTTSLKCQGNTLNEYNPRYGWIVTVCQQSAHCIRTSLPRPRQG